jgi:hypothetical protein
VCRWPRSGKFKQLLVSDAMADAPTLGLSTGIVCVRIPLHDYP